MACCGRGAYSSLAAPAPNGRSNTRAAGGAVVFEYNEVGPLTMYGRATGIRYHFPGPGARVRVDARDAAVLALVRGLSAVSSA